MSPDPTEYQGSGPLYAYVSNDPLSGAGPTGSTAEGKVDRSELTDARGSDGVVLVADKKTDRRNLDIFDERAFGTTPPPGSTAPRLVPPIPPASALTQPQAPPKLEFPSGIGPGPYAGEPIPAGPGKKPNTEKQDQINASGDKFGCDTCGAPDPGTSSGNWIGDHQTATALNPPGQLQYYLPHCRFCSNSQGGLIRGFIRRGR
jgi:hypothetical protein